MQCKHDFHHYSINEDALNLNYNETKVDGID